MTKLIAPVHPGEILKEEFMVTLGLSANGLARAVRVPPNRISAIVNGERGLTADTALRPSRAFGTTAEFWLNLQKQYELDCARDRATDLARIEPIRARV
jgi:addiction module HigA family antidote